MPDHLFKTNVSPIDIWTPVHIGFGVGAARAGVGRAGWYAAMIATEIAEAALRPTTPLFEETGGNIVMDLIAGALAYEFARERFSL